MLVGNALGEETPWCWDRGRPDACRNRGDQKVLFKEGAHSSSGKDELTWMLGHHLQS